jgi:hypothetical protein
VARPASQARRTESPGVDVTNFAITQNNVSIDTGVCDCVVTLTRGETPPASAVCVACDAAYRPGDSGLQTIDD